MGKSMGRPVWLVSLFTALVVFFMSTAFAQGVSVTGYDGRVTLDVNPSVELIFENGILTEVIAYNDEGQLIAQNTGLVGITAEESLQAILQEMAEGGYLSDADGKPYLLITAMGSDLDAVFTKGLTDVAQAYMTQLGQEADVGVTSLDADTFSQAAQLGLSAGRYVMLAYIAQTQGITLDEAIAQYGSTDINTLMDSFEGLEAAVTGAGEEPGDEELEEDALIDDEEEKSAEQLLLEAQQREAEKLKREEERLLEEQQREAEKKLREDERLLEEQQREAEKLKREEERLLEEQQREAEKKQREEERLLEEQQREAEKKQREEEQLLEEQQREAEKKQREEEQLLEEQKREAEKLKREEEKLLEEQQREAEKLKREEEKLLEEQQRETEKKGKD